MSAASEAGEDHHVGKTVAEELVEQVAETAVVAEVANAGDDDERPLQHRRVGPWRHGNVS
jgi:hypothetical protein